MSGNSSGIPVSQQAMPTPPKPSDGDGGQGSRRVSFREKLMGSAEPLSRREVVNLIEKKLFWINYEKKDRLKPRCFIKDSVLEDLRAPWKVIVKLLGKTISFFTMRDRLKAIWKLVGGFDIVDVGHGFYMVKFDLAVGREKVFASGPWMIFDHYLTVRPWVPDFISSEVKIDRTLVWIRFPSLGMEYYDESVLLALAAAVGKLIRADVHSIEASRGKFAPVYVEIELDKPMVGKIWFRDHWFQVAYEGLHLLCKKCGIFWHMARSCTNHVPVVEQCY